MENKARKMENKARKMERLTKYTDHGILVKEEFDICVETPEDFDNLQHILSVLAAYEDTGMTPEEIEKIQPAHNDGWISVKERLPDTDESGYAYVMVCMDDEFVATTDFTKKEGFSLWAESGEVIAWQPLPEPYKEDAR